MSYTNRIAIWLFVLLLLASCSSQNSDIQHRDISDIPELEIERTLQITETEDILFSSISGLIVSDSQQNIFIGDREQNLIFVFDSEGNHLDTFGGEGKGPGEFVSIENMSMGFQHDTLYVFDRRWFRINSFHQKEKNSWEHQNTFNYGSVDPTLQQPVRIIPIPDLGFALEQSIFYLLVGNTDNTQNYPLAVVNFQGNLIDKHQLQIPLDEIAVLENGESLGGINYLPFGRESILKVGADNRLYHNWTNQIEIISLNLEGDTLSTFSYPLPNPPVSEEEKQEQIDRHIEDMHELLREEIPETKPVVEDFFIDDENRFWIDIHPDITGSDAWLIFDHEGTPIGRFPFPNEEADISFVRHNNLYGVLESEDTGELSTVVYAVDI